MKAGIKFFKKIKKENEENNNLREGLIFYECVESGYDDEQTEIKEGLIFDCENNKMGLESCYLLNNSEELKQKLNLFESDVRFEDGSVRIHEQKAEGEHEILYSLEKISARDFVEALQSCNFKIVSTKEKEKKGIETVNDRQTLSDGKHGLVYFLENGKILNATNFLLYWLEKKIFVDCEGCEQDVFFTVKVLVENKVTVIKTIPQKEVKNIFNYLKKQIPEMIVNTDIKLIERKVSDYYAHKLLDIPNVVVCVDSGWNKIRGSYIYVVDDFRAVKGFQYRCGRKMGLLAEMHEQPFEILNEVVNVFGDKTIGIVTSLASMFAPLYKMFSIAGYPIQFVVYIVGQTGSLKTEIAKTFFNYFDDTDSLNSFESTAVSFENTLKLSPDAYAIFDDFHPAVSKKEENELNEKLEILVRYMGDGRGKNRSNAALEHIKGVKIRGMAVVTGEKIDGSLSSLLRCFILPFAKDSVNGRKLLFFQHNKYVWRTLIGLFIKFLEDNWNECLTIVEQQFPNVRDRLHNKLKHRRSVDHISAFLVAIQVFVSFFKSFGVDNSILKDFQEQAEAAVMEISAWSEDYVVREEPALVVIDVVQKLLQKQKILFTSRQDFTHGSKAAGFIEGQKIFVLPDDLLLCVNQYLCAINRKIPMTEKTLGDFLYEKGIIDKFPNGAKFTYRKKVALADKSYARMFVLDMTKLMSYDL